MTSRSRRPRSNPDIAYWVEEAMANLQFLDELGGPTSVTDYVKVLVAIQERLGKQIETAVSNAVVE